MENTLRTILLGVLSVFLIPTTQANPFGGIGGTLLNLFSTHPPIEERVKRLLSFGKVVI